MKCLAYLLLVLSLLGCQKGYSGYEQQVVTEHIKKSMEQVGHDFNSYTPVSWRMQTMSRHDSLIWSIGAVPTPKALEAMPRYQRKRIERAVASAAFQDTTRVGTRVIHVFRWRDGDGSPRTEQARFLVFHNGSIVPTLP